MAPLATTGAATTTLRVPRELRDEIARLARSRGTTMLDVVTDAVYRLRRDQWWSSVHDALDGLTAAEVESYRSQSDGLGATSADGLDDR